MPSVVFTYAVRAIHGDSDPDADVALLPRWDGMGWDGRRPRDPIRPEEIADALPDSVAVASMDFVLRYRGNALVLEIQVETANRLSDEHAAAVAEALTEVLGDWDCGCERPEGCEDYALAASPWADAAPMRRSE